MFKFNKAELPFWLHQNKENMWPKKEMKEKHVTEEIKLNIFQWLFTSQKGFQFSSIQECAHKTILVPHKSEGQIPGQVKQLSSLDQSLMCVSTKLALIHLCFLFYSRGLWPNSDHVFWDQLSAPVSWLSIWGMDVPPAQVTVTPGRSDGE